MKDMNGSSYKQWWQDETWALVLTVLCPIIATSFTVLGYFKDFKLLSPNWGGGGVYKFAVCFPDSFHGHRLLLYLGA